MSHLHIDVEKKSPHYTPEKFDGKCTEGDLSEFTFLEFLGVELIARTNTQYVLEIAKEALQLLAENGNGEAAKEALFLTYRLSAPTGRSSPHATGLSVETFQQKVRQEQEVWFDWFEKVYWTLPLYVPDRWDTSLSGRGITLKDPLKDFKQSIFVHVSGLWKCTDDSLGVKAFTFLCNNFEHRFFKKHAARVAAAYETESQKLYGKSTIWNLNLEKTTRDHVREAIKSVLPSQNSSEIFPLIEAAHHLQAMEVQRILAHGYVNAGGMIAPAPERAT